MINLLRWCVRIAGLAALVLGILLWSATLTGSVDLHMVLGAIVAAALALLAIYAVVRRVRIPMAIAALVWTVATIYVGMMQVHWLTGSHHWIVKTVHLLLGIGAIGMAEGLAGAVSRS